MIEKWCNGGVACELRDQTFKKFFELCPYAHAPAKLHDKDEMAHIIVCHRAPAKLHDKDEMAHIIVCHHAPFTVSEWLVLAQGIRPLCPVPAVARILDTGHKVMPGVSVCTPAKQRRRLTIQYKEIDTQIV